MTLEPRLARRSLSSDPPSSPRRPLRRLWHEHALGEELGAVPRWTTVLACVAIVVAFFLRVL